jgi:hypothetical protein
MEKRKCPQQLSWGAFFFEREEIREQISWRMK